MSDRWAEGDTKIELPSKCWPEIKAYMKENPGCGVHLVETGGPNVEIYGVNEATLVTIVVICSRFGR